MKFNTQRLLLRGRLTLQRWLRLSIFLAGGVAVGGAATLMALVADQAQSHLIHFLKWAPYAGLLLTPLGFALAAFLATRYFPQAGGSGIPQAIAALRLRNAAQSASMVSLRVAAGKFLTMTIGLICGASIGREGPTAQVGAAIMFALGRFSPQHRSRYLLAGAAAGVAAAFNAPLAGIAFGIEEMARSFETRSSGLIVLAIMAAGGAAIALQGDYVYFGVAHSSLPFGKAWVQAAILAIICGLLGGLFNRIVMYFATGRTGPAAFARHRPVIFAALCGLGVALCGLKGDYSIFGTGYAQAAVVVHGSGAIDYAFGPLKFLATTLSTIAGLPGGLFSPSLAIGAGVTSFFSYYLNVAPLGALALIGMVAYLTGVVQAPITAFIIVSEMTQDHAMVIPLMAAALIARSASKLICGDGLYQLLAEKCVQDCNAAQAQAGGSRSPDADAPQVRVS
ncbi:MAG: chloride channel protein [Rhodoblastus sp.]